MGIEAVLDCLMDAGVSVWLDAEGSLRISKGAPDDVKALVREHKQALIDVRKAQSIMNEAGIRIIRLPLGESALAYPPGLPLDDVRWAAGVLGMAEMPLVVNDDQCVWISFEEWRRYQPLCTRRELEAFHRNQEAESAARAKAKPWRRVA